MEELEKVTAKLNSIQNIYGIGGVFFVLLLALLIFLLWTYLIKRTERVADEITDKNLQKFQSILDKELVRYSTTRQKQIDAVQECYEKFQELQSFVNYIVNGEMFTAQIQPDEEVRMLATLRLDFKKKYSKYKILFPKTLNNKIVALFPELDKFIEDYIQGLVPTTTNENTSERENNEYQIAGIWAVGVLEPTLEKMDEINMEIESEFRKIYGTDDK